MTSPDDLLEQAADTIVALDARVHDAMTLGRPADVGEYAAALAATCDGYCSIAEACEHLQA